MRYWNARHRSRLFSKLSLRLLILADTSDLSRNPSTRSLEISIHRSCVPLRLPCKYKRFVFGSGLRRPHRRISFATALRGPPSERLIFVAAVQLMGGVEDSSSVKKIDEMSRIVKEKMEEKVRMESLCRTLIAEERKSHDELQEARKEFISGLKERLSGRSLKQLVFDSALVGGEEDSSVMEKIEEMSGELKQKMDASEHSSASFRRICNAVISELEEKLCVWSFKVLIFRSAVLFKGGGEASSLLKEIDEMGSHLKDMMEEVERLNCLNVDSIAKFRKGIDELWEARLDVISDWGVGDQNVGLENRRCRIVCKCAELFSFWEGLLANL